jgi:hypothetical protein
VSNTQAKAGVEVSQRIVMTIRRRIVVALLDAPKNVNGRIRSAS